MMKVQVNLLPAEYRLRAKRPGRIRLWGALCAALVVALGISSMVLRVKAADTRTSLAEVARMHGEQVDLMKDLATLNAKRRAITRQLALSDRLRRKHRWSRAISELIELLPPKVILTKLQSDPPRSATDARSANAVGLFGAGKSNAKAATTVGMARGMVIEGIAEDHNSVAALWGALDDRSTLGTCKLKSTKRQRFMEGHAVAFSITTRWEK